MRSTDILNGEDSSSKKQAINQPELNRYTVSEIR